jgi:two-component system, sensor histidine kinase and response regulator
MTLGPFQSHSPQVVPRKRDTTTDGPMSVGMPAQLATRKTELEESRQVGDFDVEHEAAEAGDLAKAGLMAELAHDLRSPLSAISIVAGFLRDGGTAEEQDKNLDAIVRMSEHMLGIVNDLMDWARIVAGHEVARVGTCDLRGLIHDVLEITRPRAEDRNLKLILAQRRTFPGTFERTSQDSGEY